MLYQYLALMKCMLISIYPMKHMETIFTPDETHVNQYLPLMKHILISIYP
jgi:hypothetical protein